MSDPTLLALLCSALRSPYGVIVETDDPEFLRQKLYPMRKSDPDFTPLAFVISPMNGKDLWILNRGPSDG